MNVAYCRVSTEEQSLERQTVAMQELGIEKMFTEKVSGKDTNRPELQKMLEFVREGDVVYIESYSRLARSLRDLLNIIDMLAGKGVKLVSLKENIDTTTPNGKLIFAVYGGMYEFERECMLVRQREGIAIAKANGKYHGRQKLRLPIDFTATVQDWSDGRITAKAAMRRLGMKPTSFYKYATPLRDEWRNKGD